MKNLKTSKPVEGNRRAGGFSLLEALVAAGILVILSAGILAILYRGQESFQTQTELNRSSEQARIAMDVMVRYLRHAGNDPLNFMRENGTPAVQILGPGEMVINSDVTGSVDSVTGNPAEATGDPDGALDSIHEQVRFRHNPVTEELFMDIGYGETLLAQGVVALYLQYLNSSGVETNNSDDVAQVNIRMIARTNRNSLRDSGDQFTMHSEVFLRSKAFNPFEADVEGSGN